MAEREKKGLHSLSTRLSRLENQTQNDDDADDFYNQMKRKERDKQKEIMANILLHYTVDIQTELQRIVDNDIVRIIVFTVKYVEANAKRLSEYLKLESTCDFKRSIALKFINSFELGYTEEFIETSIDTLHSMLYPRIVVNGTIECDEVPKKKKKKILFR